jgi:SAM-dependent methyltransferase
LTVASLGSYKHVHRRSSSAERPRRIPPASSLRSEVSLRSVEAHYREHLGRVYDWILGDFEQASARAEAQLRAAGLSQGSGALAVDLGCGSGLHSVPLLRLGYRVLALDTCTQLLQRLRQRTEGLPIEALEEDLRRFRSRLAGPAAAIVCMGDTLSHLKSREEVRALLADAAAALTSGGTLVLGFRDLTSVPERFIQVRSDDTRILTCVLEEQGEHLVVHDLLQERQATGWKMAVSSYRKLRLSPDSVRADALSSGLEIASLDLDRGLATLVMRSRPRPGS